MESPLFRLPPEVVSILAAFLPYEALERLWNTNNKMLMALMSHRRGVLSLFYLCTHRNASWPHLISKLGCLTSINISSQLALTHLKANVVGPRFRQLYMLPASLTSLKLSFARAESCWIMAKNNASEILTYYDTTKAQEIMSMEYFPIRECLPNLLRLELVGMEALVDEWVCTLPASLTHLCLERNNNLTDACTSHLPANLESLWLPSNTKLTGAGLTERSSLLSVRLCAVNFTNAFVSRLPANLTDLALHQCRRLDQSCLPRLPKHLVKLNLQLNSLIPGSEFGSLPQTLTSLNISSPLTSFEVANLPRSLIALALHNCSHISNEGIGALPRKLTNLQLFRASEITNEAMPLLPSSLSVLYLDANKLDNAAAELVPDRLTNLKISSAPLTGLFIGLLRTPNLTRLELTGLTELTLADITRCPQSVRYLHLPLATFPALPSMSSSLLASLPPFIKVLSLLSSTGFNDLSEASFPSSLIAFFSADRRFIRDVDSE